MNEAVKLSLEIAAALVAILPIAAALFIVKTVQGIAGKFGVKLPGKGLGDAIKKKGKDFADYKKDQRQLAYLRGQRKGPKGIAYRRAIQRDAIRKGTKSELERAQNSYLAGAVQNNPRLASKVAGGGGGYGRAPEEALQRALAGAKFTIEKAEAEEVKANHATIDNLDEKALMEVIENANGKNSQAKIAASMERLVKIGSNENIAKAIDQYGTSGQSDVVTKSLANALQADGPGYLKASDIDNVARGTFGQRNAQGQVISGTAQAAAKNIADGVYSPEKLVAANSDELQYASDIAGVMAASGDNRGVDRLQAAAKAVNSTPTLAARKKHNGDSIDSLDKYGTV